MKTKKFYIVLLSVLLACPIFASGFGKNQKAPVQNRSMQSRMSRSVENWAQNADVYSTTGRGGDIQPGEKPTKDPSGAPIGDTAWVLILGVGLIYGVYVFQRKRKEA